jgi:hypothetical protein
MMYIFEVASFDDNYCQVCIFLVVARYDEEVFINPSVDELLLHHEQLFVDLWRNNLIQC